MMHYVLHMLFSVCCNHSLMKSQLETKCVSYKSSIVSVIKDRILIMFSVVRADINARDNFKWTPLHHACHSGQEDLVQLLLENGAEMDAQTINGGTPLMRAIESSREAVVELLISKG